MNYMLRADHVGTEVDVPRLFAAGSGLVTEKSRARWAVHPGDRLLFTIGHGLETGFLGTAIVDKVDQAETNDLPREDQTLSYVFRVKVRDAQRFPEARSLEEVMYSLERIANFTRPWLHLRHRSRFSDSDVVTLKEGRIEIDRSIYFGLLRYLPGPWRKWLDLAAQERHAGKVLSDATVPPSRYPASELTHLVREFVVFPAQMGGAIAHLSDDLLPEVTSRDVTAVGADESSRWRLGAFVAAAPSALALVRETLSVVEQQVGSETDAREEAKEWRHHHW